ncbi:MAG: hypothetical protein FJW35_15595 [Acidobacteria bacterium]|nr:hypothetical protein [Acidobacteriota bacterium]
MDALLNYDVYFRARRLFDLMYRIYHEAPPKPGPDRDMLRQRRILRVLGRQIELLEVLQSGVERLLDDAPFRWEGRSAEDLWTDVQGAFQFLFQCDGLLPEGYEEDWSRGDPGPQWLNTIELTPVNQTLEDRISAVIRRIRGGEPPAPSPAFPVCSGQPMPASGDWPACSD